LLLRKYQVNFWDMIGCPELNHSTIQRIVSAQGLGQSKAQLKQVGKLSGVGG